MGTLGDSADSQIISVLKRNKHVTRNIISIGALHTSNCSLVNTYYTYTL